MSANDRWWDHAACHGMAPLFDAVDGKVGRSDAKKRALYDRYEKAAAVCATCPVIRQCAADIRPGRDEGIRAGRVLPRLYESRERRAS